MLPAIDLAGAGLPSRSRGLPNLPSIRSLTIRAVLLAVLGLGVSIPFELASQLIMRIILILVVVKGWTYSRLQLVPL